MEAGFYEVGFYIIQISLHPVFCARFNECNSLASDGVNNYKLDSTTLLNLTGWTEPSTPVYDARAAGEKRVGKITYSRFG